MPSSTIRPALSPRNDDVADNTRNDPNTLAANVVAITTSASGDRRRQVEGGSDAEEEQHDEGSPSRVEPDEAAHAQVPAAARIREKDHGRQGQERSEATVDDRDRARGPGYALSLGPGRRVSRGGLGG